jgi:hypothetical protein
MSGLRLKWLILSSLLAQPTVVPESSAALKSAMSVKFWKKTYENKPDVCFVFLGFCSYRHLHVWPRVSWR